MKICIVTTWHERCGVSSYSHNLVYGLKDMGHEVVVIANYPKDRLEPDEPFVHRLFHTPFLTGETSANVDKMIEVMNICEVVHFSFETSMYHLDYFTELAKRKKEIKPKIAFTMHTYAIWPGFPDTFADYYISHSSPGFDLPNLRLFPIGIKKSPIDYSPPSMPFKLRSFGLGRNNDSIVSEAIKDLDIEYQTSYGNHKWLNKDQLDSFISQANALVLMYHPISACVSSSAAAQALGFSVPLIISDTNWFSSIKHYPGIFICNNSEEVREAILYIAHPSNFDSIKMDIENRNLALVQERRTYSDFLRNHNQLYHYLASK